MRLIFFYQLRSNQSEAFHFANVKVTFAINVHYHHYDSYFAVSTSDIRFTISPPIPKLSRMIFPSSSLPTIDIKRVFFKPSLSSASATFRPTPPQLRLLRPVCVLPSFWK
ncbi:hypothetical protein ALC53_09403 [Atta colombica]|uniref:Uncharacterized protein n=1 Tax=Atta colombica TaxID=520822 RepID=A0A195B7Y7_9HYME|nr:hypothetical protein ALC53_09403 [Atta colombica]